VLNKIDLSGHTPGRCALPLHAVAVSVATGAGMDVLRAHLVEIAVGGGSTEGQFMARRRHLAALAAAFAHLRSALDSVERVPPELIAEELRQAHQELGRITGTFGSDDLLGQIFSGFCIGK
jgi:tRNA modification GTPase